MTASAAVAALLLLLALVVLKTAGALAWGADDLAVAAALVLIMAFGVDAAYRRTGDRTYRLGAIVALGTGLLLVWANFAVGLMGDEGNRANLFVLAVVAVAIVGALLARGRPAGLARAMAATAAAQTLGPVAALAADPAGRVVSLTDVVLLTLFFSALWLLAAWLFGRAARRAR